MIRDFEGTKKSFLDIAENKRRTIMRLFILQLASLINKISLY